MSQIAFNEIASTLRTPGVYIEADNSNANTSNAERHKLLLLGHAAGSINGIQQVYSASEATNMAGAGSELALMAVRAESAYKHVDVYMAQAKEPESGTAASIEISFVATDAQAGTLHLLVCGQAVSVAVLAGTTAANIAKAVADTLKTRESLPVSATNSASKVKLTCKHKGEHGNRYHVSLRSGYGMTVPSGVSVTIPSAGFSGGAGVADITDVITAMGDDQYHYIALAHINNASIQKMHAEMARRYEAGMMIGGRVFAAHAASMTDIKAFADGYNTPHIAVYRRLCNCQYRSRARRKLRSRRRTNIQHRPCQRTEQSHARWHHATQASAHMGTE